MAAISPMKTASASVIVALTLFTACNSEPKQQSLPTPPPEEKAAQPAVEKPQPALVNSKLQALFLSDGFTGDFSDESLLVAKVINGGGKELHTEGFEDFKKMPNIETITIGGRNSTLTDDDLKKLSQIELPNIEGVMLPFTPNITPTGILHLLNKFPTLKRISVIGCQHFSSKDGDEISKSFPDCKITGDWNF